MGLDIAFTLFADNSETIEQITDVLEYKAYLITVTLEKATYNEIEMRLCDERDSNFDLIESQIKRRQYTYGPGVAFCQDKVDEVELLGSVKGSKANKVQFINYMLGIKQSILDDPSQYYKLKELGTLRMHSIFTLWSYNPMNYGSDVLSDKTWVDY